MRISDWSSDVCSSDLGSPSASSATVTTIGRQQTWQSSMYCWSPAEPSTNSSIGSPQYGHRVSMAGSIRVLLTVVSRTVLVCIPLTVPTREPERRHDPSPARPRLRSEEHTSELQSLMRISYAVFCL